MQLFGKDLSREVAIVAEAGVNHEGDPEAALRLLRLAKQAGADAIKFQSYTPARYASASDPARLERVGRFALDEATHRRLAAEAARLGIVFFSTAVSEDVVPLLAELCPAIKIASADLTFEPVVRAAARTGKPVILSTGLGTPWEIDQAVDWVRQEVGAALPQRLVLLQCVVAYPTPLDQANVASVGFLKDRYGLTVGYSNHVIGLEPCLAAVALGARLLEVHVTDRREGRSFRDHELSLEPAELAELVMRAPKVAASLGSYGKSRQAAETALLPIVRKGVVAARDLGAGTRLAADDLMYARPATEFPAAELPRLIGRRLTVALKRGELVPRAGIAD